MEIFKNIEARYKYIMNFCFEKLCSKGSFLLFVFYLKYMYLNLRYYLRGINK